MPHDDDGRRYTGNLFIQSSEEIERDHSRETTQFAERWPQEELDGLASKEVAGVKVILPVWHNISLGRVRQYSPMLAGRVAARSSDGLATVLKQLREAMGL